MTDQQTDATDETGGTDTATGGDDTATRRFKFPTALTVLAIVLLAVWVASFFIPAGVYDIDPDTGGPVPGSYHELLSTSLKFRAMASGGVEGLAAG